MRKEKKYKIIVKDKTFAKNLNLKQAMKISVYLGKKGIPHRECLESEVEE